MEFSRQEYWHGLPFPFPGDLPDPGIQPGSPALWADSLPPESPGKLVFGVIYLFINLPPYTFLYRLFFNNNKKLLLKKIPSQTYTHTDLNPNDTITTKTVHLKGQAVNGLQ